jgi:hypothetical protein
MGDFFLGGGQLNFDLLKHDGKTYRKIPPAQPPNYWAP